MKALRPLFALALALISTQSLAQEAIPPLPDQLRILAVARSSKENPQTLSEVFLASPARGSSPVRTVQGGVLFDTLILNLGTRQVLSSIDAELKTQVTTPGTHSKPAREKTSYIFGTGKAGVPLHRAIEPEHVSDPLTRPVQYIGAFRIARHDLTTELAKRFPQLVESLRSLKADEYLTLGFTIDHHLFSNEDIRLGDSYPHVTFQRLPGDVVITVNVFQVTPITRTMLVTKKLVLTEVFYTRAPKATERPR